MLVASSGEEWQDPLAPASVRHGWGDSAIAMVLIKTIVKRTGLEYLGIGELQAVTKSQEIVAHTLTHTRAPRCPRLSLRTRDSPPSSHERLP